MDEDPPWPEVLSFPTVTKEIVDLCRFGLTINGTPIRKTTEVLASSQILAANFLKGKRCTGDHDHLTLEG